MELQNSNFNFVEEMTKTTYNLHGCGVTNDDASSEMQINYGLGNHDWINLQTLLFNLADMVRM